MSGTEKKNESVEAGVRAFIAIRLPDDVIEHLRQVQSGLKKESWPVKWVEPGNIHLTLKFLGNVSRSALDDISAAMQSAAGSYEPLMLAASGLGAFPGVRKPRVLWAGVNGDLDTLAKLHAALEEELSKLGIEKEGKKFKGHLTLGRIKGKVNPESVIDAVKRYGGSTSREFKADCLRLYQSELKPSGPIYKELFKAALGAVNK